MTGVWGTLQDEDTAGKELLVLPTTSPPPVSEGIAVGIASVLITSVSPSGLGVTEVDEGRPPTLLVED